jgi:hypothetical protein
VQPNGEHEQGKWHGDEPEDPEFAGDRESLAAGASVDGKVEELRTKDGLAFAHVVKGDQAQVQVVAKGGRGGMVEDLPRQ